MTPNILLTLASSHIVNINQATIRQIYNMIKFPMQKACDEARDKGFLPISAVDDLTIHKIGPWIDTFAKCLSRLAKLEKISIVGGEMAQMKDSYTSGYVGFIISVVSIKE